MSLFTILDGIINSDHTSEILADAGQVIDYAEQGCGESIDYEQAKKIIEVGTRWIDEMEKGNGEWSRMRHDAKDALSGA